MIKFESVHLQRGVRFLLQDANLVIHSQQKIGLIGANGTGKTSFFKLILGELHEDAGQVSLPKNWLISHMAQELDDSELSALDFVLSGDEALCRLHEQMLVLEGEALARVYESIEAIDGYTADTRAHKLLVGLGFSAEDAKKPVSSFSGGWRIRLNLARALMCRSDLLLLDEPTNHLDLDATVWLEQWLQNYNGTLLIISHDRDFLDSVVGHIVHLENQILATYMGNYSSFEVQRADRLSQQAQAFNKQQARISEIESFVRRFKAKATKAKQAQSRIKELDRMQKVAAVHVETPFDFKFPKPEKLPQTLLSVSDATVGYHTPIVENIQMTVLSNSRVGLLGRNGSGKSTLLKALAGATHLLNGDRVEAQHLKIGYYSQHQLDTLDFSASPALHLQRIKPKATEQVVRNFLGGFGFQGDRAFECIEHFSGGEKARLALSILAWQEPNLLLLDEPTNHLDLEVRQALTHALQMYEGAVLLVSHDRHLLKNTVDEFYLVDEGAVHVFDGDLEDYQKSLNTKDKSSSSSISKSADTNLKKSTSEIKKDKKERRQQAAEHREKLKPLRSSLKKNEQNMMRFETQLAELEVSLADSSVYDDVNKEKLQSLIEDRAKVQKNIDMLEVEWLALTEDIEKYQ